METWVDRRAGAEGDAPVRAMSVGILTRGSDADDQEASLDELERLIRTAGGEPVVRVTQSKATPDPRTAVGQGKVEEIRRLCRLQEIELVVFDCDLDPMTIRNLEKDLRDGDEGKDPPKLRVIDRSMLILDIFALRAVTSEGKLQVELAQWEYTAPRLTGHGAEMSRLGGGIGTRGPGESQLESDRRHIHRRIRALKAALARVERNRRTMRAARDRSGIVRAAIVGYTNAGKSTLLNALTDAGALVEDRLFATLDPMTRKYALKGGGAILLTDTVGFIRKLPHHLVDAFRSTLEEAVLADVILLVSDASDPACGEHLAVTERLLEELGAGGKPIVYVFNKCDRGVADPESLMAAEAERRTLRSPDASGGGADGPSDVRPADRAAVYVSAKTGQGLDRLAEVLRDMARRAGDRVTATFLVPATDGKSLAELYGGAFGAESAADGDGFVRIRATVDQRLYARMRRYAQE